MASFQIAVILAMLLVNSLAQNHHELPHYAPIALQHQEEVSHYAPIPLRHQQNLPHYAPITLQHQHEEAEVVEYHHAHPKYEFKYGVKDTHTNDIKEQAEKRDGDKVEGYYKLLEADGTTRTVHYTADKHTGFHAQVVRSGHAIHPANQHH